jgi:predicted PolB exonuclease-like 3'-5' exonuclease
MNKVSASTKIRRLHEFSAKYKKAMCELSLMFLSGMIDKFDYETYKAQINEAFNLACDQYGIVDRRVIETFVPAFALEYQAMG